jgi:Multidrug resistance efflux pump
MAEIDVDFDTRRRERITALHERRAIPAEAKEDAERRAELSQRRLAQVRQLARERELELARARELLELKTVRATLDGFVVERYGEPGEYVEDQPLLRIAALDPLTVHALLPLRHFGRVEVGMTAEVQPEGWEGPPRRAR